MKYLPNVESDNVDAFSTALHEAMPEAPSDHIHGAIVRAAKFIERTVDEIAGHELTPERKDSVFNQINNATALISLGSRTLANRCQ